MFTITLFSQENQAYDIYKKFHADSIKSWTKEEFAIVQGAHPGFYRYTSKERFDAIVDSTLQTVTDSLTTIEYYRKIKPLYAQIGCLHTSVNLPEVYLTAIEKTPTLLPLEVFIDSERKVFITKNHSANKSVPIKGELLSINKTPINEIISKLVRAIPSDGYNQTEKILALNLQFSFWYQSMIDITERFEVEIDHNGQHKNYTLEGILPDAFTSKSDIAPDDQEQLSFEIKDGIGFLKVQDFSKSVIKKNGQNFKKFIREAFKTLDKEQVGHLVIDLRYNTGGTDGNAATLASYFFDEEFRYWDRIEVTEGIAKQVRKGLGKVFFSKPKPQQKDSLYLWKGALLTNEFNYYKPQKPAKYNFSGETYLLTNGFCMSSAADFIAILSDNGKAKVIGEESGGGYQGNTSGMMPNGTLSAGFIITIPIQKYVNAVDPAKNVGRGTIPDYPINLTVDDWISKRDVAKEFTMDLIKSKK